MCKKEAFKEAAKLIKEAVGLKTSSVGLDTKETIKSTKEVLEESVERIKETLEKAAETPVEEEWIWVNGFKGMDKNMQCWNNFQYEIGKTYDMPEDATIEACSSGFHMCLNLNDVFNYVDIGDENRFFEVRALVRKSDKDLYQSGNNAFYNISYTMVDGYLKPVMYTNKLAAKSIEIVRELTADEILESHGGNEWDEKYKRLALEKGVSLVLTMMETDELVSLGYSLPFARWLSDNKKFKIAKAVGSQTDLSMDMKCLMIMNGN